MSDEDTKLWIYAGALPYELTEGDIVCVFSQYGEICEISLSRDKDTGKSRGFCFIKYENDKSCELAVDNFHETTILGRKIKVSHANNPNAVKSRRAANVAPQEGDNNFIPKVLAVEKPKQRDERQQASSSRLKEKDGVNEIEDGQLHRLAIRDKRDVDEASPLERSRNRSNYKSTNRTSDRSPERRRRHQSDSPLPPLRHRSRSQTPSRPSQRDRDRGRRSPEHRHHRDRHRHHRSRSRSRSRFRSRSKSRSRSRSREGRRSRKNRSPRERSPREHRHSPRRDRHRHRSSRDRSKDRGSRHRSSERRHHRHRDRSNDRKDEPRRR